MKRFYLIFGLLMLCLTAAAQSVDTDLKVDSKLYDFGAIQEAGGRVSHSFRLTNTGSEPIVILSVRTGCRCVSALASAEPIAPGKSTDLTVMFDPAGRAGSFHKEVTVITEGKKICRVNIKGNVVPAPSTKSQNYHCDLGHGLKTNLSKIDFGRIAPGSSKSVKLRFMNDFPVGMHLSFDVDKEPRGATLLIPSSHLLPPDGEGEISLTLTVTDKLTSPQTINLIPTVNGYQLSPIPLTIQPNSSR